MTYTPALPLTGYAGWVLLKRTMAAQQKAFTASAQIARDEDYFKSKIGQIKTAEDLVADRRLLKVALGAFGLDDDITSKFFIRKILESNTLDTSSLANRLSDKKYLQLASAFGFGDYSTPRTQLSTFADEILSAYETRSFETAVGEQDDNLRLALNAERELGKLAAKSSSETTKWFTVLGDTPLRTVFEKALGLPTAFGQLDVDKQLEMIRQKAEVQLGSADISQFSDASAVTTLVRRFLVRSEISQYSASTSGAQAALTLLQSRLR
jgi:hypothetical protein